MLHDWRLNRYKDDIPCWICENCGAKVHFRRPNLKRKFDGMSCGELMATHIHES